MKKLITGGTGLVGSSFKEGIKVSSKDCNLKDYDSVYRMIQDINPDVVVHTAAKVGGVGANLKFPADFFYDNIIINTNVIDVCAKLKVPKLICFLSTCIFPDKIEYPLSEDNIHDGPPHPSNFAYSYAKRMGEIQIHAYNKQYDTKYFSVIPTNIYGPNDNFNLENGHVIPNLIHKCFLAKKNKTPFEIWGTGKPLREFMYSEDVSNLVDLLIENYDGSDPVLLSNPKEYQIKDVVNMIVEIFEFDGEVKWLSDKPDGQYRKTSTNKKLKSIVGDYKFVELFEGLKKTIDWFTNQDYNNVRW